MNSARRAIAKLWDALHMSAVLRVPPWLIMMQTQLSKFSKPLNVYSRSLHIAGQLVVDFAALGFSHVAT